MTLVVKNEADIIGRNIAFHLREGVKHIIATDHASTDGTLEILERYQSMGYLTLLKKPEGPYLQKDWVNQMVELSKDLFGDAWVFNNDADEFWRVRPNEGRHKTLEQRLTEISSSIISCPRANMITSCDLLGTDSWTKTLVWRSNINSSANIKRIRNKKKLLHPFFCYKMPRKLLFKNSNVIEIEKGSHSAKFTENLQVKEFDIEILHFPIRDKEDFIKKIYYHTNTATEQQSAKYQAWRHALDNGENHETFFKRIIPDKKRFYLYRATGLIRKDQSMTSILENLPNETHGFPLR